MRRPSLRRAFTITALAIASTTGALAPATIAGAATSRAVIVIESGTSTISFSGTIKGVQALMMVASVETVGSGAGTAICKINGVGNPAVFGQCLGETTGKYWSYWKSPPGSQGWTYSNVGAGSSDVTDGSVEGWHFGTTQPPPYHSFCSVAGCGPPPPPPTSPPTAPPTVGSGAPDPSKGASTGTSDEPDDTTTDAGGSTTSTSTGAAGGEREDESNTSAKQSASGLGGRPEVDAEDDDGSPVGIAIAGGVVAGLGGAGVWLRRRRLVTR